MKELFYQIILIVNWAAFAFFFYGLPAYYLYDYAQYEYLRLTGVKTQATLLHKNIEEYASQKANRRGKVSYKYYFHYTYVVPTTYETIQNIKVKKEVDSHLYSYEGDTLEIYYSQNQVNFSDIDQNTLHKEGLFSAFFWGGIGITLLVWFFREKRSLEEEDKKK